MYCNRSEESTPHCNRSVAVKTSLFGVVMDEMLPISVQIICELWFGERMNDEMTLRIMFY